MMRRVFAVMGMFPVGYYDLSTAGVPVHSTAFRPVGDEALSRNPFRVFTSLLRLDLIDDETLRGEVECILSSSPHLHGRRCRTDGKGRKARLGLTAPTPTVSSRKSSRPSVGMTGPVSAPKCISGCIRRTG